MTQQKPPDGHWQWVPAEPRRETARRTHPVRYLLFFIGVALVAQCFLGWNAGQAFQQLLIRHISQIERTEQGQ